MRESHAHLDVARSGIREVRMDEGPVVHRLVASASALSETVSLLLLRQRIGR